jgi:hypothetical protein
MLIDHRLPVEIILNFDTTGSLFPILKQIRANLENTLTTLFKEIPNLRIGVGANGDYGDKNAAPHYYVTKNIDLTTDLFTLTNFVRTVLPTHGFGNGGEAYELVLHEAAQYSWSLNARKILVMISDEPPHTPSYHENVNHYDWRKEAQNLAAMGVQIYTIQCLSRRESNAYNSELASIGNGYHLHLDQFTDITDLVMGIFYRQVSEERVKQYETEFLSKKVINRTLDRSFATLTNRSPADLSRFVNAKIAPGLVPVDAGRFQLLNVESEIDIKRFVLNNSLPFKKGKGFYKFEKTEIIQENKEVVLRHKDTGDYFSGTSVRDMIGLPFGTRGRVKPNLYEYDIFVQSNSVNRKLKKNSDFLYEVDMSL